MGLQPMAGEEVEVEARLHRPSCPRWVPRKELAKHCAGLAPVLCSGPGMTAVLGLH